MAALTQSLGNLSNDELKKVIPMIQDMAAGMHIDLDTAARLFGKTLGSTTNALTRYGVVIDATAPKTEKLAQLQGEINRMFGGRAEDVANTYLGRLEQLKNRYGDLKESIGRFTSTALKPALEETTRLVDKMVAWLDSIEDLERKFDTIKDVLKDVVIGYKISFAVAKTYFQYAVQGVDLLIAAFLGYEKCYCDCHGPEKLEAGKNEGSV